MLESGLSLKQFRIILIFIVLLAITSLMWFIAEWQYLKENLGDIIFQYTFQFLLLVVVGGAISFLFTYHMKAIEERAKEKEKREAKLNQIKGIQRKFYNDYITAYNEVKRIRRFFKARSRIFLDSGDISIHVGKYDELMIELTSVQLRFEFFCKEVDSNRNLFDTGTDYEILQKSLKSIENTLNNIVNEYENLFSSFPNKFFLSDVISIPIEKLPELQKFLDRSLDSADTEQSIKHNSKRVPEILLKIILDGNSA